MIDSHDEFINEKYINLFPKNDVADKAECYEYWEEIDKMLKISYYDKGGYLNGEYNADNFIRRLYLMKLVRKNGKIIAFRAYSDRHGRKAITSGSNDTDIGKSALYQIYRDDINRFRAWGEVSDQVEHLGLKYGGEYVPNELALEILGTNKIKLDNDGIHYYRLLSDKKNLKADDTRKAIMVGDSQKFIQELIDRGIIHYF